jgi:hypothetical protein
MPFVKGTMPQPLLSGAPVRSFEELVPAPPVPLAVPKPCVKLDCL